MLIPPKSRLLLWPPHRHVPYACGSRGGLRTQTNATFFRSCSNNRPCHDSSGHERTPNRRGRKLSRQILSAGSFASPSLYLERSGNCRDPSIPWWPLPSTSDQSTRDQAQKVDHDAPSFVDNHASLKPSLRSAAILLYSSSRRAIVFVADLADRTINGRSTNRCSYIDRIRINQKL